MVSEDKGQNKGNPSDSSPKRAKFSEDSLEDEDHLTEYIKKYFHDKGEDEVEKKEEKELQNTIKLTLDEFETLDFVQPPTQ